MSERLQLHITDLILFPLWTFNPFPCESKEVVFSITDFTPTDKGNLGFSP